ncbi:MAG: hypothetical protein M3R72_08260 [Bacteroidota bacterium]|nr:hypothetical protein [Bacteroidota bacterium]
MKIFLFLFLAFTLSLFACKKSQVLNMLVKADGKIIAGVGCTSWLIELDNSAFIQPTNLSSFNITIHSGQIVSLTYKKSSRQLSTCMTGEVVDLFSITNR